MQRLSVLELWIAFGVGKHYRYVPAHSIASAMGSVKSSGLPFFHSLTGCDTTSAFAGRGKKTAWDIWAVFPEISSLFTRLSTYPADISGDTVGQLERFVVLLYAKTSEATSVNEARQSLFAQGSRDLENISPTQGALKQHIKRAVYQAAYVWGQTLVTQQELPSPADWGWERTTQGWIPKWTDLPEVSKACYQLIYCGCKKACRRLCKCLQASLKCSLL